LVALPPQGKIPWYPLDRRLGGPQNLCGCGGEEKNSQPLSGLEPQIIQPIAQRCTAISQWVPGYIPPSVSLRKGKIQIRGGKSH